MSFIERNLVIVWTYKYNVQAVRVRKAINKYILIDIINLKVLEKGEVERFNQRWDIRKKCGEEKFAADRNRFYMEFAKRVNEIEIKEFPT